MRKTNTHKKNHCPFNLMFCFSILAGECLCNSSRDVRQALEKLFILLVLENKQTRSKSHSVNTHTHTHKTKANIVKHPLCIKIIINVKCEYPISHMSEKEF